MDRIELTDEEKKSLISIDGYKLYGASYYFDGRVSPISDDVTNLFKAFLLSKDNTKLPNEGKYRVILDNKTGFKHYFIGKEEDFIMFYLNNGEDATEYYNRNISINSYKNSFRKEKYFKIAKSYIRMGIKGFLKIVLYITLLSSEILMFHAASKNGLENFTIEKGINYYIEIRQDLTVDDLISKINESPMLTDSQKRVFANRNYLSTIIPFINKSDAAKIYARRNFDNITVKFIDTTGKSYSGYHNRLEGNVIYVTDRCAPGGPEEKYFSSYALHEFDHLCQLNCYYNVLSEAVAELSKEFDSSAIIFAYPDQRYITTKLMEIIGSDPVLEYTSTDNINVIKNEIKPYLSSNELEEFLRCLHDPDASKEYYNYDELLKKLQIADSFLDKIYFNKFGIPVEEDPVIPYLKNETLIRYYFDKDKARNMGSFVVIVTESTKTSTMKLDEALSKYDIKAYYQDKDGNTRGATLLDYLNNNGKELGEFLNYSWSDEYKVKGVFQKNGQWYVTLEETEIIDADIKDLPNLEEKLKMLEERKARSI